MELFPFDRVLHVEATHDSRAAEVLAARGIAPRLRAALLASRRALRHDVQGLLQAARQPPATLLPLERSLDRACAAYESLRAHVAACAVVPDPAWGVSDFERIRRVEWFRGWFGLLAEQVRVLPWRGQHALLDRVARVVRFDPACAMAAPVADSLAERVSRVGQTLHEVADSWENRREAHRLARLALVRASCAHAQLVRAVLIELGHMGEIDRFILAESADHAVVRWRGDELLVPCPLPGG